MTLLEVLALLTLVSTVIYETVDITLKVMQYIDEKQNKRAENHTQRTKLYRKNSTKGYMGQTPCLLLRSRRKPCSLVGFG